MSGQAQYPPSVMASQDQLFDQSTADCQPRVNQVQSGLDAYGQPINAQAPASALVQAKQQHAAARKAVQQQVAAQVAAAPARAVPVSAPIAAGQGNLPPAYAALAAQQQAVAAASASLSPAAPAAPVQAQAPTPGAAPPAVADVQKHVSATKEQLHKLLEQRAIKDRDFYFGTRTSLNNAHISPEGRRLQVGADARHVFQYKVPGEEASGPKGDVKTGIILKAHLKWVKNEAPVDIGVKLVSASTGKSVAPGRTYDAVKGGRYLTVAPACHTRDFCHNKKGLKLHQVHSLSGLATAQRYGSLSMESITSEIEKLAKAPHIYMVPQDSPVVHLVQKNSEFLGIDLSKAQAVNSHFLIHHDIVEAVLHEINVGFFQKNPLTNLGDLAFELERMDAPFNYTGNLAPYADPDKQIDTAILQKPFGFSLVVGLKYLLTSNVPNCDAMARPQ